MEKDASKFATDWQPISKDSDIAKRFNIPRDITVPFFLFADEAIKFQDGEKLLINDYNLLVGLLVQYFNPPPLTCIPEIRSYFRNILFGLLEVFQDEYGYDTPEKLVLAICAELREKCTEKVSRMAFRTGIEIFPEILGLLKKGV